MTSDTDRAARRWTLVGLGIALAAMPLVMAAFAAYEIPRTPMNLIVREAIVLGFAGCLIAVIRYKERLGWRSVGLQRVDVSNTVLWVFITIIGVMAALAASFGLITLFGWRFGAADGSSSEALPLWVTLIIVIRAGFVEELFYRGYAIERLEFLSGSRMLAVVLPLLLFAAFHYRQGWAGITIALLTGSVLTAVYVYKRNLWITVTTHFLVDFVPNIVMPLVTSES